MNIKEKIRASGYKQWQVARKVGIAEVTLCVWLRVPEELPKEKVARIEKALKELSA